MHESATNKAGDVLGEVERKGQEVGERARRGAEEASARASQPRAGRAGPDE
jgi:hypothetical protein